MAGQPRRSIHGTNSRTRKVTGQQSLAGTVAVITDADGRRPDWGAIKIDFSKHPEHLIHLLRTGSEIRLRWLEELKRKTKCFLTQLPSTKTATVRRTRTR
jgi:hypothetical protein